MDPGLPMMVWFLNGWAGQKDLVMSSEPPHLADA